MEYQNKIKFLNQEEYEEARKDLHFVIKQNKEQELILNIDTTP